MKQRVVVTGLAVLWGLIANLPSYAEPICTKDGGDRTCVPAKTTEWKYRLCDAHAAYKYYTVRWCYARHGKWIGTNYGGDCLNEQEDTEENLIDHATRFVGQTNNYTDTGWGITVLSQWCWSGKPTYEGNILIKDSRRFDFYQENNIIESIFATKNRTLVCPNDTQKTRDNQNNIVCTLPPQPKCSASVGNPCSITTGNKFLNETDWQSAKSPLKVSRYYNSLQSNTNPAWTTNYNLSINIGEVQDSLLNLKAQGLEEQNTVAILKRLDGRKIIYWNGFIDKDENLSMTPIYSSSANTTKNLTGWTVKNTKTGIIETYQPPATITNIDTTSIYAFTLARVDYPNGQFLTFNYDSNNRLIKTTDNLNQSLTYSYNTTNQLANITLPNGKTIDYGYDTLGRLITVKRPGFGVKTYVYDEADKAPNDNPNLLTGIIDENGKRYATYAYDPANRGILTEHAGNSQRFSLSYQNGYTLVTDEYGANRRYNLQLVSGANRVNNLSQGSKTATNQFDQVGNLTRQTSNGITTTYTYDLSRNLQTSKVEAVGTTYSRVTLTEWASDKPVKTKITQGSANADGSLKQALRIISFTHDNHGNVLTKTITDPTTNENRTWTYTYNSNNQPLTETTPTGLTTTWVYDNSTGVNQGNLLSVTNPQGQTTTYADYNSDGKPQTMTSPTGQITKLTYDDAGRVLTQSTTITTPTLTNLAKAKDGWINFLNWWRKLFNMPLLPNPIKHDISQSASQTATTTYQYDGVGQLIKTTLPDGDMMSYRYDDAHRLIGMTDNLGNKISYTLNGAGDIIKTQAQDPNGSLKQQSQQVYNTLGQLQQETGNNGQYNNYRYDNRDNLTQTQDALARSTSSDYDALNRKIKDVDANGNPVTYVYNALDQLVSVTDANQVLTSYRVNAFGETTSETSPDSGTTTREYHKGKLVKQTDGAGRVQTYHYDDKGRLAKRVDGTGKVLASYQYDDKGRIGQVIDTSDTTVYRYNSNNQVIEKQQTTNGQTFIIRYHYTVGGKLDELLLPSGRLLRYGYDKGMLNRITIKHDDKDTDIISNLTYEPNGIASYTWAQTSQVAKYQYDLDGRLTQITDPALTRHYGYDVGNRMVSLLDNRANINHSYQHDKLDRLTSQNLGQLSLGYMYDSNSNRTQKTTNGVITKTSVKTGTNQYQTYTYDGSGKVLNDGVRSYIYNSVGRIERIQQGTTGIYNVYNSLGQRVQKNVGNNITYFVYDEAGKLLSDGKREYVYLGNVPVALLSSEKPNEILQIHTDHLGTPRAVSDKNAMILWRWEGDAFGNTKPQLETVTLPLRMAGQYHDTETGLFYNYHRYYDPSMGRYITSDPLGLIDGTNPFNYVSNSPLLFTDFKGLAKWKGAYVEASVDLFAIPIAPIVDVGGRGFHFTLQSECETGVKKKYTVQVWAVSAGANIDRSVLKRVSFGVGTAEFDDNNGTQPNPNAFTGFFGVANTSFLAIWTPLSYVNMGSATGNISGMGLSTDLFAFEAYAGYSKVWKIKEEECACE